MTRRPIRVALTALAALALAIPPPRAGAQTNAVTPPLAEAFYTTNIVVERHVIMFKSVIRMPGLNQFVLRMTAPGVNPSDRIMKIGDEIGGWVIASHEPAYKVEERFGRRLYIDKSTVTLKRGDETITIMSGRDWTRDHVSADIVSRADGSIRKLRDGEKADLLGQSCTLQAADPAAGSVTLKRDSDGAAVVLTDGKPPPAPPATDAATNAPPAPPATNAPAAP